MPHPRRDGRRRRLRAMRQPAESYSDVIPRLAQLEAGGEPAIKIKRLVPDRMAGVRKDRPFPDGVADWPDRSFADVRDEKS